MPSQLLRDMNLLFTAICYQSNAYNSGSVFCRSYITTTC